MLPIRYIKTFSFIPPRHQYEVFYNEKRVYFECIYDYSLLALYDFTLKEKLSVAKNVAEYMREYGFGKSYLANLDFQYPTSELKLYIPCIMRQYNKLLKKKV